MRKYVTGILILGLFAGYFYISKQDKLVINAKGKIEGLGNKFRALVQQKGFWENQLKTATGLYNKSLAPHPPSSADIQALYKKFREAENALNEKMKDLYTPDERVAEEYRIKADSILRASKWKIGDVETEAARSKETENYKAIVKAIETRLQKKK
jgi:hypothetical protein